MNGQMPNDVFDAFLSLMMCADPSPLDADQDKLLRDWANQESERRGYSDWIEAYHENWRRRTPAYAKETT